MKQLTSLFLFCLLIALTPASAQTFEGQFLFMAYEPDYPQKQDRYMELFVTPDRILMQSEDRYSVLGGLSTSGLLIRHDKDDFIFRTSNTEAMRITREDVGALSQMIQRVRGGSQNPPQFDWDRRLESTGETKMLHGYQTEQFKVYQEDRDEYISVWLTDGIKINWGILDKTWHESTSLLVESDLPIEVFINRNSFPLLIEYYKGGRLNTVVEALEVARETVDKTILEIPEDIKMMGITDLMMRMMKERR